MYKSYKEKLRDPRWQRKKNSILERDNYTCQSCKSTTKTLEVHHLQYIYPDPWDITDDLLITLCSDCHRKEEGRDELEKNLATTLRMKGFLVSDLLAMSVKLETDIKFPQTLLKILREFQDA